MALSVVICSEEWRRKLAGVAILIFFLESDVMVSKVDGLGVNWGTQMSHMMPSNSVVQMLQNDGFNKVKLFDANPSALAGLAGSKIEVMVGIPNDMLATLATSTNAADNWVQQNVSRYRDVNIKYVAVGNEPFLNAYNGTFENVTIPALQNIQQSLAKANLAGQVKVTVPLNADVLTNPNDPYPSFGVFRDNIKPLMLSIVSFLDKVGGPFTINLYPFISLHQDPNFPKEFAFFDGTSNAIVDGSNTYTNVFDASYDLLVAALKNAGYPNLPIIVGEVGWPTDGDINANVQNAQRFNQGLLRHIVTSPGTPLRPGIPIEVYLFSLIDEDQKSIAPGSFERHWGLYTFDGQRKYSLDLTGKGSTNSLVNAQGIKYLPSRWCVLNTSADMTTLGNNVGYACGIADCTSLSYGGTCNFLSSEGNASYAFNSYYQLNNQTQGSCNFQGLATITTKDPSNNGCRFEVQIAASSSSSSSPAIWHGPRLVSLILGYAGYLIGIVFFLL
ncbi:hypothetical protein O6H91_07G111400 [Diphasiastrum complanatum]|uniref:Uncharacterized protein n=2 Tax=Diphasiastrum complanatum TaxID=34168 RepID=A0ACC2D928_DIPCM|nr:hypothetical protein O6H91_07G111400 [Diphasiastrum complanatum]KAJ7550660.1 hypothetical protein O6H91_07G111400 [Diphasiastrum complanatum]